MKKITDLSEDELLKVLIKKVIRNEALRQNISETDFVVNIAVNYVKNHINSLGIFENKPIAPDIPISQVPDSNPRDEDLIPMILALNDRKPEERKELLSRKEAAEILGIKENTLSVWAVTHKYKLPYVKVGRYVRYRRSDLMAFIEQNTKQFRY